MSALSQPPLWRDSAPSTPSSAVSLASPHPWLESALVALMTAISGRSTPDSFAWLDPDGWWRKTLAGYVAQTFLAAPTEDEEITVSLAMYCATWPRWGIARDGVAGKLRTPARPTRARGSLSWPTPLASEADTAAILSDNDEYRLTSSGNYRKHTVNGTNGSVGLSRLVMLTDRQQAWPTPQSNSSRKSRKALVENRQWSAPHLEQMVELSEGILPREFASPDELRGAARDMWPTPRASANENRTSRPTPSQSKGHGRYLAAEVLRTWHTPNASDGEGGRVAKEVSVTGRRPDGSKANTTLAQDMRHAGEPGELNPDWEELLMGFPLGWTNTEVTEPQPWAGWPSLPQEPQRGYEPPRTVPRVEVRRRTGVRKIRNARLKVLGNAVVPAQAAPIFAAINAVEGRI